MQSKIFHSLHSRIVRAVALVLIVVATSLGGQKAFALDFVQLTDYSQLPLSSGIVAVYSWGSPMVPHSDTLSYDFSYASYQSGTTTFPSSGLAEFFAPPYSASFYGYIYPDYNATFTGCDLNVTGCTAQTYFFGTASTTAVDTIDTNFPIYYISVYPKGNFVTPASNSTATGYIFPAYSNASSTDVDSVSLLTTSQIQNGSSLNFSGLYTNPFGATTITLNATQLFSSTTVPVDSATSTIVVPSICNNYIGCTFSGDLPITSSGLFIVTAYMNSVSTQQVVQMNVGSSTSAFQIIDNSVSVIATSTCASYGFNPISDFGTALCQAFYPSASALQGFTNLPLQILNSFPFNIASTFAVDTAIMFSGTSTASGIDASVVFPFNGTSTNIFTLSSSTFYSIIPESSSVWSLLRFLFDSGFTILFVVTMYWSVIWAVEKM